MINRKYASQYYSGQNSRVSVREKLKSKHEELNKRSFEMPKMSHEGRIIQSYEDAVRRRKYIGEFERTGNEQRNTIHFPTKSKHGGSRKTGGVD